MLSENFIDNLNPEPGAEASLVDFILANHPAANAQAVLHLVRLLGWADPSPEIVQRWQDALREYLQEHGWAVSVFSALSGALGRSGNPTACGAAFDLAGAYASLVDKWHKENNTGAAAASLAAGELEEARHAEQLAAFQDWDPAKQTTPWGDFSI